MKTSNMFYLIIGLLVLLLLSMSIYTIHEGQLGLLKQLGKIVTNKQTGKPAVKKPGLHFKYPFINQVLKYDARIQTFDIQSSRIVTSLQKDVLVDYYAKWRIDDLALFYTRTGGNRNVVETLLSQKLNDALRAEFGKRTLKQVVSVDRAQIMSMLYKQANENAKGLGIKVIDVRIKGIDLPKEVSDAVYGRMRTRRNQVATEFRAKGKASANAIRAQADAEAQITIARAKRQAQEIRAKGDTKAASIYAKSYNKDSEFYAFYRSLEAYKMAFDSKQNVLVLQPDSQFFKYFNSTNNHSTVNGSRTRS